MMNKGLFALVGLFHSTGALIARPECNRGAIENEMFKTCYSSSCKEAKCIDGKFQEPGFMCTADCNTGCVCKSGFARNAAGTNSKIS
jgi:hypothetical protein